MTDFRKESIGGEMVRASAGKAAAQVSKSLGGPPLLLPNHPARQLSFDQKMQLCLGWLRDEFEAYQRGGGKDSVQAWVQSEIEQALQAAGRPPTTAGMASAATSQTAERKTPASPPDLGRTGEPGVESEGLGPIQWLLWGWEVKTGKAAEAVGEAALDWVIDELSDSTGQAPDDGTGEGDGSYGTSPGQGDGIQDSSTDGTGDDGQGGDDGESGDDGQGGDEGGDEGGGGEGCFVAGTPVHTGDGDRVAIEEVALEAKLASCDAGTGIVGVGTVTRRFKATSVEVVTVAFADEALRCTPRHRFFTASGWMAAGDLSAGTEIYCLDGTTRKVLEVSLEPTETAVFNLRVDWQHTYYVGEAGYLVHNEKDQNLDDGTGGDGIPDGSVGDKV